MAGVAAGTTIGDDRLARMRSELASALERTDKAQVRSWALRSAGRIPSGVGRRAVKLGKLAWSMAKWLYAEGKDAVAAGASGQLQEHAESRARAAVATGRDLTAEAATFGKHVAGLAIDLTKSPERAAPELLGLGIGFFAGSGGLDGDGGIPDLDLLPGIGAHRSIFTHSIIAGAVAEAMIASTLELVLLVHGQLPSRRDPLWDTLALTAVRTGAAARIGIDLGLATHLAIDGTIDGMTPYKDLPGSLPMDAHRAILLGNAAAQAAIGIEGARVLAKKGGGRGRG